MVFEAIDWLWHGEIPTLSKIFRLLIIAGIGAIVSGWLFGWFIRQFSKKLTPGLQADSNKKFNLSGAMRGPANHFRGIEARGGEMLLEAGKLYFNPHQFNIQRQTVELAVSDILSVEKMNYFFGLVDSGIKITSSNGRVEKFVVGNREQWIAAINAARLKADS